MGIAYLRRAARANCPAVVALALVLTGAGRCSAADAPKPAGDAA